jgi:peptide methionine sulfoxide reductase MsrA
MGYTGGHVDEKNWRVVCTTTATTVRSVELGAK